MNKKKCIVFGITSFAEMLVGYLEHYTDYKIAGYVIDRAYKKSDCLGKYPIVEFEKVENIYSPLEYDMFLALGYKNMNDLRKQKYIEAKEKGYTIASFIHPTVTMDLAHVGEGNIIFENVTLSYGVEIGNCNIIWNGCQISHETKVGDFNFFAPATVLAGKVTVENNCFCGINSAVRGANTLKNYTLVGAGCYMNNSSEEHGVYVPARALKLKKYQSRDML